MEIPHTMLASRYLDIKQRVIDAGFASEIDWQDQRNLKDITETELLSEVGWVIMSSGMRESVVRNLFAPISTAFLEWECAKVIIRKSKSCAKNALKVFNHQGKVHAILTFAEYVANYGFEHTRNHVQTGACNFLTQFPFLGPATSRHLAKNLGLDIAKPDRHLCRLARRIGADSVDDLCQTISDAVGDRVSVVDLVLWRFATLGHDYDKCFH